MTPSLTSSSGLLHPPMVRGLSRRRAGQRPQRAPTFHRRPFPTALCLGLCGLIGTGMLHGGQPGSAAPVRLTRAEGTGSEPPRAGGDRDQALWQSPTGGAPLTLAGVPQGVKCLVHVNWMAIAASPQAQQTYRAFGAGFAAKVADWEREHGLSLATQRNFLFASVPRANGTVAVLIRGEPTPGWSVPDSWKPLRGQPDQYASGDLAARVMEVDGRRFWLLGDPDLVRASDPKTSPVLQRQLERLRNLVDQDRQVALLTTASFLWTYGAEQWGGGIAPLLRELELEAGRGLQALALSFQIDDLETYLELATIWRGDALPRDPTKLRDKHANLLRRGWQSPLTRRTADPYWQALATRLPTMFDFVVKQLRVQRQPRFVLANASLPPTAAHNLVLATELALNLPEPGTTPLAVPQGDLLASPISLQFGQQSLIDALAALEHEVQRRFPQRDFSVTVDGEALRAAGITRNQQIRNFDQVDAPIHHLLTELVRQANPEQAVSPADPAQKLVWVAKKGEPTANSTVILITTREAAAARSLELPAVFTNS